MISSHRLVIASVILTSLVLLAAGGSEPKKSASKKDIPHASVTDSHGLQFADIAQSAGLRFLHNNGAFGKKYLPEALGPGCAFIDYDNDGYPDVLLINGKGWPGHEGAGGNALRLYHNNRNGTFTDVTASSGLGLSIYGIGGGIRDLDK